MASDYLQMLLESGQFIANKLSAWISLQKYPKVLFKFLLTMLRITTFGVISNVTAVLVSSHRNWNTHYQGSSDLSDFSPNSSTCVFQKKSPRIVTFGTCFLFLFEILVLSFRGILIIRIQTVDQWQCTLLHGFFITNALVKLIQECCLVNQKTRCI